MKKYKYLSVLLGLVLLAGCAVYTPGPPVAVVEPTAVVVEPAIVVGPPILIAPGWYGGRYYASPHYIHGPPIHRAPPGRPGYRR